MLDGLKTSVWTGGVDRTQMEKLRKQMTFCRKASE